MQDVAFKELCSTTRHSAQLDQTKRSTRCVVAPLVISICGGMEPMQRVLWHVAHASISKKSSVHRNLLQISGLHIMCECLAYPPTCPQCARAHLSRSSESPSGPRAASCCKFGSPCTGHVENADVRTCINVQVQLPGSAHRVVERYVAALLISFSSKGCAAFERASPQRQIHQTVHALADHCERPVLNLQAVVTQASPEPAMASIQHQRHGPHITNHQSRYRPPTSQAHKRAKGS